MAIIKCKMCGGDLEVVAESRVAVCEYCGTQQTVPGADNEKKLTLFGRANRLRMACEFDKAAGVYESIVVDFPEEAEAYWGLVLCKYGIEYVDDPATGKKIPTCHRSSFDSVMDDSNLEQALENADAIARRVYRDEAKTIEELRKGIIEISGKEAPYDIFICYKETDDSGDRTIDSVIAQEVYDALTEKGYRVFFSRITLEDKLGQEYEPYIFAALHSAKIMLAFGTDYEYYNAVWVKNEWSRFLQLIASGEKKTLIPCYKNIDAYDMPKEFARLQAQDMGKVGAMQDLLRGIEKILPREKAVVKETVVVQQSAETTKVQALLERAFLFLEDGDWSAANEYCEKVLDIDPKCAEAYLGKLMIDLRVKKQEELADCVEPFDENANYIKAVRFGDDVLRDILAGYLDTVTTRIENAKKDEILAAAEQKMTLDSMKGYRAALELLDSIPGWKDADEKVQSCQNAIENLKKEQEGDHKKQEESAKQTKKIAAIVVALAVVVIAVALVATKIALPSMKYNDAVSLMESGQYEQAIIAFEALGGYKESLANIVACNDALVEKNYRDAVAMMDIGNYAGALPLLEHLEEYEDSEERYEQCFRSVYGEELWSKIESINPGDAYTFGSYNGRDIEWLTLKKEGTRVLLISKNIVDKQHYHENKKRSSWEFSALRSWLNNEFLDEAFSDDEKAMIPTVIVSDDYGPNNSTEDKVFLLSVTEVREYFESDADRKCVGASNGWWLRTLGVGGEAYVRANGEIDEEGASSVRSSVGVRPAMWIDLGV